MTPMVAARFPAPEIAPTTLAEVPRALPPKDAAVALCRFLLRPAPRRPKAAALRQSLRELTLPELAALIRVSRGTLARARAAVRREIAEAPR